MKSKFEILFMFLFFVLTTGYAFAMTDPYIFQLMINDLGLK